MFLIVFAARAPSGCSAKGCNCARWNRCAGIAVPGEDEESVDMRGRLEYGSVERSLRMLKLVCTKDSAFWSASKAYTQRPTMETRVPQKADEDSSAPVISGTGNAEISNQFVVFWLGAWNVRAWTGTGRETRPGRHRAGQFVLSGKNGRSSRFRSSGPPLREERFRSFRSRTNRPARRRPGRVARPARPAAGASAWQTERRKDRRLAGPWRRSACRRVSGGGGSS